MNNIWFNIVSVAEVMKFDNGILFWDVSFFKGVHARELEALASFMDNIYGASIRGLGEDKMCWKSVREKDRKSTRLNSSHI